ncbi:MAG TPA: transcriptional repressor LexA [Promineifilum sp.]|nr:transcriptional repressor LexA [Promineifilum sp.]
MSEKPLSKRQQQILQFTRGYMDEHGRPPTIREIGKAVEINSTSVVNYNLGKLEEKGYLDRDPDVSRGLRLTEKAEGLASSLRNTLGRLVRIPLAGDIVAGRPVTTGNDGFSTYDDDEAIELSYAMLNEKPDGLFALRVRGESMIDAMVNDGDIVIMKPQYEAKNGEMVAVWLRNDTTTLKKFYHEGDRIRLQPANPTMEPIYVDPEDVQVQGRVLMVLRQPE